MAADQPFIKYIPNTCVCIGLMWLTVCEEMPTDRNSADDDIQPKSVWLKLVAFPRRNQNRSVFLSVSIIDKPQADLFQPNLGLFDTFLYKQVYV